MPSIFSSNYFILTFCVDISSFVTFCGFTVYWTMRFMWKCKCQCGSVKCEWSPAELNGDFPLMHSRMLFFIEQYTYFSRIPLWPHCILQRRWQTDVKAARFHRRAHRDPRSAAAAAAAGSHQCCDKCKERHAIWLSSLFLPFLFFPLILSWGWVISCSSRRNHAAANYI